MKRNELMEKAEGLVEVLRLKGMGRRTTLERDMHKARIEKAKTDLGKAIKESGNECN